MKLKVIMYAAELHEGVSLTLLNQGSVDASSAEGLWPDWWRN